VSKLLVDDGGPLLVLRNKIMKITKRGVQKRYAQRGGDPEELVVELE